MRGFGKVGVGSSTYVVSLPKFLQEVECPVPGCLEVAHSAVRLQKHFMYRHSISNVAVVQEGVEPLPRCYLCIIYMPAGRLIRHRNMACCNKNTQMRWRRQDVVIVARYL